MKKLLLIQITILMSAFSFAKIEVLDRVAIIVDENSSIEYAAKDFLAQAEHGEDSRCFLIHLPGFDLNQFNKTLKKNLSTSKRKKIINEA